MSLSTLFSSAKREWNPYQDMGGTCAALSGPDFVVFASDTRMNMWDSLLSRDCDKIAVLDNNILLGTCGFYGDILHLLKFLHLRLKKYKFNYQHEMSVGMCANMLARVLYSRRFFPLYTGCMLGGLDANDMTLLQSFNYNDRQFTSLSASLISTSPFLLLFILLLINCTCIGRMMFSSTEEVGNVEKNTKIGSEFEEKANSNVLSDELLETTVDSIKMEEIEQNSNLDQSPPPTLQKENFAEVTFPSPTKQSIIDTSTEQPDISSFPTTTTMTESNHHLHTKRNYASKECGAKVLYSNEEAENRGAILNDPERDDYMRNPCERAQNKFLIIELCETIQLNSFEIANFELFSSNPKDFRLWSSERYPTQEWVLIGDFEAQNIRQVQSFDVKQTTSYAKFVKLELLTHYGNEHFCTLSTFVIYGTSIIDEYEAEAASSTTLHHQHQFNKIDDNLVVKEIKEYKNNVTLNETIEECSKNLIEKQVGENVGENGEHVGMKTQQQQQKPVTPTYVLDERVSRPLPGTSTNSKESIFMKLNKRLVLLEQNMSTSNEHLNELTKRVGMLHQQNGFNEQIEKIVRTTAENVAKHETKKVREEMQLKINDLQFEVRRLSQLLNTVLTSIQPFRPDGTTKGIYSSNNEKTCMNSEISPSYYSHNTIVKGEETYVKQGLWTTNEVIIVVIIVQICTLIVLKLINLIMTYIKTVRGLNTAKE
ncbi:SUN domain-containing protein [Meloidogyne graminicola]|uniref:SUN domain-containing protein n=1 Tax=Meloidogyne graminicola TaxID=189291 RepID=A0A8S9ZLF8_9BILA|nr:SUN domain-containing protein [Meloidogyne graminicola]